jgi:hypothetical protein
MRRPSEQGVRIHSRHVHCVEAYQSLVPINKQPHHDPERDAGMACNRRSIAMLMPAQQGPPTEAHKSRSPGASPPGLRCRRLDGRRQIVPDKLTGVHVLDHGRRCAIKTPTN